MYTHIETQPITCQTIRTYGAASTHAGFMLYAVERETPDTRVPYHRLRTNNNPHGPTPHTRSTTLRVGFTLAEMIVQTLYENVAYNNSRSFVATFMQSHTLLSVSITNGLEPLHHQRYNNNNLPRFVFVGANRHMYALCDHADKTTTFEPCSALGGNVYKRESQHTFGHVKFDYNLLCKNCVTTPTV